MKTIKAFAIILFATMFANSAFAQVYEDELHYYKKEGYYNIIVAKFDYTNDRVLFFEGNELILKRLLKEDPSYFDNESVWDREYIDQPCFRIKVYKYDTKASGYYVYKRKEYFQGRYHSDHIYAFSEDLSTIVYRQYYVSSGSSTKKIYFYEVNKEDYLPKTANYDFLED